MHQKLKQLGRVSKVLIGALALGSIFGISAAPAIAEEEATWNVQVQVSDSGCVDFETPAIWTPDMDVYYLGGNSIDLDSGTLFVDFEVYLNFTPGYFFCDPIDIDPTGDVEALFTTLDAGLTVDYLDCSAVCPAANLMPDGKIAGSLDASSVAGEGTYSGQLKVLWTPEN